MGNDMFNDEQLAYAEIVQKVTEDALGFWKDRALKAEAKLADKYLIEEQYEAACGDRDGLLRMVETLRERKDKLEAERDDIAAWAESWMKRVAAAERERDEARAELAEWTDARKRFAADRAALDVLLSRPAPVLSPEVREAAEEARGALCMFDQPCTQLPHEIYQDQAIEALRDILAALDADRGLEEAEDALRTVAHLCGSEPAYYTREAKAVARRYFARREEKEVPE